jgi:hypothetical protein
MTLPAERTRAVVYTREFLVRLANAYGEKAIKRIPKEVRNEALRLLKHYPSPVDLRAPSDAFDPEIARLFFSGEDEH